MPVNYKVLDNYDSNNITFTCAYDLHNCYYMPIIIVHDYNFEKKMIRFCINISTNGYLKFDFLVFINNI